MPIYPSIYDGPPKHYGAQSTAKRYVAIHNTSNDASAEVEASYAQRREDSVSSHYYVDSNSIVQSLNTDLRAFHAGSAEGNSRAIAYEITGTNGKTRPWWLANVAWTPIANQIALDCRAHGIEPRLLTVAEIKAGSKSGIITHDQMRQAWGGTTHDDPGPNFPLDFLVEQVQAEMGDDMNWDDPINGTINPKRTFRQVLQDLSNERDWRYGADGSPAKNPPPEGSRAQLVVESAQRAPVAADVAAFKAALTDPEVLAALAKAINDDAAARMAS